MDQRIIQADCIQALDELPANSVDLVVTSPPYNIGKEYEKPLSVEEYVEWCGVWMKKLHRVTKFNGSFWLNLGYFEIPGFARALPISYLLWNKSPFYLIQEVVWHYGAGVSCKKNFSPRNEKFLWFVKNPEAYTFNLDSVRDPNVKYPNQKKNGKLKCNPLGKNPGDVWIFPKVTSGKNRSSEERTPHPAQFPLAVIERIVKASSNEGDTILDPFLGSGTTLVAAYLNDRKGVGIEIRDDYCQIAKARLQEIEARGVASATSPSDPRRGYHVPALPDMKPETHRTMQKSFEGITFYQSVFNKDTGHLVRITVPPKEDLSSFIKDKDLENCRRRNVHSPSPETIDIQITDWCNYGCPGCYMDSTKKGQRYLTKDKLVKILQSFDYPPYQVALGGGEPTAHPEFIEILKAVRDLDIIPNYTTAGHMLTPEILTATKKYCGGVALSYHSHMSNLAIFKNRLETLFNHTDYRGVSIHVVADRNVTKAIDKLIALDIHECFNLVLLAFYPVGRAKSSQAMDAQTYNFELPKALTRFQNKYGDQAEIAFSEGLLPYFLSRPGLGIASSMSTTQEGLFSCYINVDGKIGVSSFEPEYALHDTEDGNYQWAWLNAIDSLMPLYPSTYACHTCPFFSRCNIPHPNHAFQCAYQPHNSRMLAKESIFTQEIREREYLVQYEDKPNSEISSIPSSGIAEGGKI